jgi:anti-sigma factor RsiW
MSCEGFRPFIDAYVDGEFDERESAEMEAHLERCDACRTEVEHRLRLKEALQETGKQQSCPEALKKNILDRIESHRVPDSAGSGASKRRRWTYAASLIPLAAGIALVFTFYPALTVAPAASGQLPVVEQTVDWHRNDLPVEIRSAERAHVARWFRGKVDFPVRLPDFRDSRVNLLGGRLAHIKDRRAANVSYDVGDSRLSVMIFHGDKLKVPTARIQRIGNQDVAIYNSHGYGVAIMQNHGITYAMTSDLPENDLIELVASSLDHPDKKQFKKAN